MTSKSLHESFLNFHCLIKREQELHALSSSFHPSLTPNNNLLTSQQITTLWYIKRACELNKSYIISTDEDPGLRIESLACSNKFMWCFHKQSIICFIASQTYKELITTYLLIAGRIRSNWSNSKQCSSTNSRRSFIQSHTLACRPRHFNHLLVAVFPTTWRLEFHKIPPGNGT